MNQLIAKVLLASRAQHLDRLFDYVIPPEFTASLQIGARVIVPFQEQLNLAYVWEITDHSEFSSLKSVREIIDNPPLLTKAQYTLINWLADYYFCSRVDVIQLCMPPGAKQTRRDSFRLAASPDNIMEQLISAGFQADASQKVCELLAAAAGSQWIRTKWQKEFQAWGDIWEWLLHHKLLMPVTEIAKPRISPKTSRIYQWALPDQDDRSPAGLRVKKILLDHPEGMAGPELAAAAEVSTGVIRRLLNQGKINYSLCEVERVPLGLIAPTCASEFADGSQTVQFNSEQQAAFDAFRTSPAKLFLLHGVTGSGKTEVYFEAAAEVLRRGQQVLYLVPEIALTPQTMTRARHRFGDQVALLHSNMSDGERYDQWFRVKNGQANFLLGARSSLFAPFTKLGLVIMDEEHETTYKQEETPRYHARRVVEQLVEITGAKAIFGSATPALDSFFAAQTGKYQYLQLTRRYNDHSLPDVAIVDMREELRNRNKNILSRVLHESIQQTLDHGEQVILLLNRRGYATFILCRDCGQALRCPSCDVALTYHANEALLRCHYCDYRQKMPDTCPNCHSNRIRYFGHGTQKLEEELTQNFPQARLIRMDLDSTSKKGAHYQIFQKLTRGEFDILLGTQMIAKGLDLPRVTLVGVITADSSLNLPDFRAAERTFHLLTQVAGRAGRGSKPGRVIFQTYNPAHYALKYAQHHDYLGFYQEEVAHRSELNFPPFTELFRFGFSGIHPVKVSAAATEFCRILHKEQEKITAARSREQSGPGLIEILGPAPAVIPKIQDRYRWQILIKAGDPSLLKELVQSAWSLFPFRKFPEVQIVRDRNPYSL